MISSLTPIQEEILEGIKGKASFYLTGGAALGLVYLGHRRSLDLDLFVANEDEVEAAVSSLESLCRSRGWRIMELRRYPGFRRLEVASASETTLVDVVFEPVAQVVPFNEKPLHRGLRVDSREDIAANKLCALLGRGEVKDLVDVYFLAKAGLDPLNHIAAAALKDGGVEPATLAFVLRGMPASPAGLLMVEPVTETELAAFRDTLVERLLALAWPGPHGAGSTVPGFTDPSKTR